LSYPTRGIAKFRQSIIKLDTSVTKDWSMYYRYQRDKIPTEDANSLFSSGSGLPDVSLTETNSPGSTHTFNTTYVVTPNLVIEAGYTFGYGAILSGNIGLLSLARSPIMPPLPFPVTAIEFRPSLVRDSATCRVSDLRQLLVEAELERCRYLDPGQPHDEVRRDLFSVSQERECSRRKQRRNVQCVQYAWSH
jgi:hypothetical protein